jgi:hypothetical protein
MLRQVSLFVVVGGGGDVDKKLVEKGGGEEPPVVAATNTEDRVLVVTKECTPNGKKTEEDRSAKTSRDNDSNDEREQ